MRKSSIRDAAGARPDRRDQVAGAASMRASPQAPRLRPEAGRHLSAAHRARETAARRAVLDHRGAFKRLASARSYRLAFADSTRRRRPTAAYSPACADIHPEAALIALSSACSFLAESFSCSIRALTLVLLVAAAVLAVRAAQRDQIRARRQVRRPAAPFALGSTAVLQGAGLDVSIETTAGPLDPITGWLGRRRPGLRGHQCDDQVPRPESEHPAQGRFMLYNRRPSPSSRARAWRAEAEGPRGKKLGAPAATRLRAVEDPGPGERDRRIQGGDRKYRVSVREPMLARQMTRSRLSFAPTSISRIAACNWTTSSCC